MVVATAALARGEAVRSRRRTSRLTRPLVGGVLSAIAIIPSAPVMVPELAGDAAAELADLRDGGVRRRGRHCRSGGSASGSGRPTASWRPDGVGTFAGYGVDVPRGAVPAAARCCPSRRTAAVRADRGLGARPGATRRRSAEVRVYADDHDVDAASDRGRRLRAEIDEAADPIGVLVVADGAHTLTPPAPGGYDPDSIPVQAALDDALAAGDVAALTRLPDGVVGRVAYQVLAGLAEPAPRSAKELYRGAPYGVGYFVGVWQP